MINGNVNCKKVFLSKGRVIFGILATTLILSAFFLLALDAARNFGNTVYCRESNVLIWDENSNLSEKEVNIINQSNFEKCMKTEGE